MQLSPAAAAEEQGRAGSAMVQASHPLKVKKGRWEVAREDPRGATKMVKTPELQAAATAAKAPQGG
jgi:hypothetical protein